MTDPRVSVVVITYNHERFLAQALDGVLAQTAPFGIEILISEDHSTDATRAIIAEYVRREPARIRTFFSERNLNTNRVGARAIEAARGEFVALLDGDDYWTSPHKLATQVAYLDAHPECAMCFHDVLVEYEGVPRAPHRFVNDQHKRTAGTAEVLDANFVPGGAPLLRRQAITPLPAWYEDVEYGDWPLYLIATAHGSIGYIDEVLGAYRRHSGGYWSGRSARAQYTGLLRFFNQLAAVMDERHHAAIRATRARWHAGLARALADDGEFGKAWRESIAALRDDLRLSRPIVRRRVVDLIRYASKSLRGSRTRAPRVQNAE